MKVDVSLLFSVFEAFVLRKVAQESHSHLNCRTLLWRIFKMKVDVSLLFSLFEAFVLRKVAQESPSCL